MKNKDFKKKGEGKTFDIFKDKNFAKVVRKSARESNEAQAKLMSEPLGDKRGWEKGFYRKINKTTYDFDGTLGNVIKELLAITGYGTCYLQSQQYIKGDLYISVKDHLKLLAQTEKIGNEELKAYITVSSLREKERIKKAIVQTRQETIDSLKAVIPKKEKIWIYFPTRRDGFKRGFNEAISAMEDKIKKLEEEI